MGVLFVVILVGMAIVFVVNELIRDNEEHERDPNRYRARRPGLYGEWWRD